MQTSADYPSSPPHPPTQLTIYTRTETLMQSFPREDLDHTLREIAKRYNELREQLLQFSSDDPAVNQLRRQAAAALEAGEFEQAEVLLNRARDRDLEAAKQLQEVAQKRLLSAAASAAANGDLKYTQLAYVEAASIIAKPRT